VFPVVTCHEAWFYLTHFRRRDINTILKRRPVKKGSISSNKYFSSKRHYDLGSFLL